MLGASVALWQRSETRSALEPAVIPATGALTVAMTGDTVLGRVPRSSESDSAADAVLDVVRGATLALTNLEMSLLTETTASNVRAGTVPAWPFGSAREAAALASFGFDVVGQANNHAADYGQEGLADTSAILRNAGLLPAGAGRDLDEARAPVMVGGGRRIAVLAVAISAPPESTATEPRGSVSGRPGVNPLRYVADVTVDANTFETLRRSAPALQGGGEAAGDRFVLLGTSIKKGTQTSVSLVPDARDLEGILMQVARAREAAEVVVLSVHSHEPSNESDEPAELFTRVARQAIDAGAQLVVGHGPHRLRGVERYKGGAILYSVGNFLYLAADGATVPSDAYDAGLDMYGLALGMSARAPDGDARAAGDAHWDGVVGVAAFDGGTLRSLRLHPVDLGVELPEARRGLPRQPSPARAAAMLERLARLSQPYGTTIRVENGVGLVDLN
jgi:poly-gamma-glutamate synthesis protein (capsule biosynthesis protein)